jgi:hypothetical protein
MLIDMTGKFEVLASEYAKTIVREESNPIITGYRWNIVDEVNELLWFVSTDESKLIILYNETEAEEW